MAIVLVPVPERKCGWVRTQTGASKLNTGAINQTVKILSTVCEELRMTRNLSTGRLELGNQDGLLTGGLYPSEF